MTKIPERNYPKYTDYTEPKKKFYLPISKKNKKQKKSRAMPEYIRQTYYEGHERLRQIRREDT